MSTQKPKLKYFMLGGGRIRKQDPTRVTPVCRMFNRIDPDRYERASTILEADIVVFMGGADVTPQLYNQYPLTRTMSDTTRDMMDISGWHLSRNAKLRLGICRGAQFLNVMSGGELWQHLEDWGNHRKEHTVLRYKMSNLFDVEDDTIDDCYEYEVTSTHHQQMIPGPDARILGYAVTADFSSYSLCSRKFRGGMLGQPLKEITMNMSDHCYEEEDSDIEFLFYPKTKSLCIQGHPEFTEATDEFVMDVGNMIEEALCAD